MSLASPRLWITLLSAGAVIFFVVGHFARKAPGPLAAVHAKLSGRGNCSDCHGGLFETMVDACLECHEMIGTQIEAGAGLHGLMGPQKGMQCALCHGEHNGTEFDIINRQSFALAGVGDPTKFDHARIGYTMEGKHLELECTECHEHAQIKVLPEGEHRYLGLDQGCATCHEDAHEGRYVLDCTACHGQESFPELHSAGHEKHLPLIGGHGGLACATCHDERDELHSLERLGRGGRRGIRACQDCHESPHTPVFAAGAAQAASLNARAGCVVCHQAEHVGFRDEALVLTAEQHAHSGFQLTPPHDAVTCDECHPVKAPDFTARYPGREADDCSKCHGDPHGGQFSSGPFATQGCLGCHDRRHFEPHAFTVEKHALSAMPLTGSHIDAKCELCHRIPKRGDPRTFRGAPLKCEGCHPDAHDGFFAPFAAGLPDVPEGECARCHKTTEFSEIHGNEFDHHRWTDFAVRGAHAQSECDSCHQRTEKPDEKYRTFGRIRNIYGKHEGCKTCHEDPHRGEFDRDNLPREVGGKTGCERCHTETSFRSFPDGFDHNRWTGFPLHGAHGKIGCSECHKPLRKTEKFGRTWARAKGDQCADCHQDPHVGQFIRNGSTSCERCHRSATTYSDLSFRHDFDSRFKLGDAHRSLACDECHKAFVHEKRQVIRYRPVKRLCIDCHGAANDPLRRRKEGKR